MLRTYGIQNSVLRELSGDDSDQEERLKQADWIDLQEPDELEREQVDALYPQALPDADDVEEIEASARYYSEGYRSACALPVPVPERRPSPDRHGRRYPAPGLPADLP